jgi:molecular chaperone DnaK (HSP70)
LIRKNTPIPVSKSEVFFTSFDGQTKVDIGVYQGEDPDALNNIEIGQFTIEGLRDAPSGNPIVTTFSIDVDGILHVTSREKATGLEYSITINNAMTRLENDKLDEARVRVRSLFGEEASASGSETENRRHRVEALALMEKAERLLEKAGAEDGEDLVNAIEAVKDAMDKADEVLQSAMDSLADLLYYLEA